MNPTQNIEAGNTASENSVLHDAAAEALCASLPVSVTVTARRLSSSTADSEITGLTETGDPAVAAFVGSLSADVAVYVDPAILGDAADLDPRLVSMDDVLRPAFEAATGVLGTGVLSSAPAGTAKTLLHDADTVIFELLTTDRAVGWFALRLREPAPNTAATSHGPGAPTTATSHPLADEVTSRLSRLNNVQMALTVEIGRTRVSVRDVLAMEPGAVIELDRNAGAPADVRLNGRLIALGEVVVMDQDYGVRITKILDSSEGLA